jgi:hypothetical protein
VDQTEVPLTQRGLTGQRVSARTWPCVGDTLDAHACARHWDVLVGPDVGQADVLSADAQLSLAG